MDDREVLQHLLELEAKADALVNDAQAEADRRIALEEKQCRARYDEAYLSEVKALEESLQQSIAAEREEYKNKLKVFRESLAERSIDMEAFSALAEEHLDIKEL